VTLAKVVRRKHPTPADAVWFPYEVFELRFPVRESVGVVMMICG
jgi:hypothetical protein